MFGDFPFGLMFLNLVGMVLFFLVMVMAVKLLVRGARGYGGPGAGGPWRRHWAADCGRYGGGDWDGKERGFAAGRSSGKGRGRPWNKHHGSSGHELRDQALEHANLRMVRGEITTEQYQELRSALAQATAHSGVSGGQARHGRNRALGIARLRLASGEIGVEEFNTLRAALES